MSFERDARPGLQIATRQDEALPVTRVRLSPGVLRYAYDLSRDSHESQEPGQDYLTFRYSAGRLAFAVCDGVGGSFLGYLAAQYLGERLSDWLWASDTPSSTEDFRDDLSRFLHDVVPDAREWIERYRLATGLSPLIREVLEKKRAYGSEAMFVCGRIEWPSAQSAGLVSLGALGDAELQVWSRGGDGTVLKGTTQERWSTHRGARGQVRTSVRPARDVLRVIAYSDGLGSVAAELHRISDNALDHEIARLRESPSSDDISLIDIALDETHMAAEDAAARPSPAPRRGPSPERAPESIPVRDGAPGDLPPPRFLAPPDNASVRPGSQLKWTSIRGAESYQVQQATSLSFDAGDVLDDNVPDPWLIVEHDEPGHYCYRVRALAHNAQSGWSSPLRVRIEIPGRQTSDLP